MQFNSLIVAKHSPKNRCYGKEGEILYLPTIPNRPMVSDRCAFIGAQSKEHNELGWVKIVEDPFSLEDFSRWSGLSSDSELIMRQKVLLEVLMNFEGGTPVTAHFVPRGLPPKPVLVIHKVIFYSD